MGKNPSNFSYAKFRSKLFGLLWVKDYIFCRRSTLLQLFFLGGGSPLGLTRCLRA